MATIATVSKEFLARRAEIDALDQGLDQERRAMEIAAFDAGRDLTDTEKQRRKEIGATRQELAEALRVLALTTLERLNDADDVAALNNEIARINEMLKDDLEHLKKIEEHAKTAAKVLAGLASVAKKVANFKFG